jgi:hypothetical protein
MFVVSAVVLLVVPQPTATSEVQGSSPIVTTTLNPPRVTSSPTATPTATPTPTPSPTPSQPSWTDWRFEGAAFSVPAAGLEAIPIHQLDPATELVEKDGYVAVHPRDNTPEDLWKIAWDPDMVGCTFTPAAANTCYIYGHDYQDGSAVFSYIYEKMGVGDTATITTPVGAVTYALEQKFNHDKHSITQSEEFKRVVPGRLVVVTCYSDGNRDQNGNTTQNSVLIFQMVTP